MSEPGLSALALFNRESQDRALATLLRCCGSRRWALGVLARRPFASVASLYQASEEVWAQVSPEDYLEAFGHHPQIGEDLAELRKKFGSTASLSVSEQAGAMQASESTLSELRELNQRYRERFGYIFIVCATGQTAEQMLAALRARLPNPPEVELALAAAEQAKITYLRLEKHFA